MKIILETYRIVDVRTKVIAPVHKTF